MRGGKRGGVFRTRALHVYYKRERKEGEVIAFNSEKRKRKGEEKERRGREL